MLALGVLLKRHATLALASPLGDRMARVGRDPKGLPVPPPHRQGRHPLDQVGQGLI